jgi:hypothetical protein
MSCISSETFVVLINGTTSPFFHAERGIRHVYPLSPLFFILVVEGLSCALENEKSHGLLHGIAISLALNLTHLLFVDYVLLFYNGQRGDAKNMKRILDLFSRAIGMQINERKYTLLVNNMEVE